MSDRSATTIEIGGTLPTWKIPQLAKAIDEEGCGLDWETGCDGPGEAAEWIEEAAKKGESLTLLDNEHAGGSFPSLEAVCRDLGVAYHRSDDGHYAYPPEHVAWFPGMAEPIEGAGTTKTDPYMPVNALLLALDEAKSAGGDIYVRDELIAKVADKYRPLMQPIPPLVLDESTEGRPEPEVECDCGWTGLVDEVEPISKIHERVAPGEIMPVGACPMCDCLAHYIDVKRIYPWHTKEQIALHNAAGKLLEHLTDLTDWVEELFKEDERPSWLPETRALIDEIKGNAG